MAGKDAVNIFGQKVRFHIDLIACFFLFQARCFCGMRNDGYPHEILFQGGDSQADPVKTD